MVDLVKIRKKAKDKKDGPAETPAPPAPPSVEVAEPAKPAPVAPQPPAVVKPPAEALQHEPAPGAGSTKLDRFKREAGRRRETEAAAQTAVTGQELLELLTFDIAGEQYAVDIEKIVEIVPLRTATRVPNAHPSVVGIVSLRGTVVTLVDVRRKLRHATAPEKGPDARIVVVEYAGETLGFPVDRVLRVVKVDPTTIEPHPVVHASEYDDAVRGVFRIANALTILLDLDKLLDSRSTAAVVA